MFSKFLIKFAKTFQVLKYATEVILHVAHIFPMLPHFLAKVVQVGLLLSHSVSLITK